LPPQVIPGCVFSHLSESQGGSEEKDVNHSIF
jgi:hypothetical protein